MELRTYQQRLFGAIIKALESYNKVLLYALCGCGKTIIGLSIAREFIKLGKRVAISCYSMCDIRSQWQDEIREKFPDLWAELQIVCSVSEAKKYSALGIPAVSNGGISKTKLLTIFIPQTIRGDLGKFDMMIIDEAHERLEVKNADGDPGKLKELLKRHSKPTTQYLGLTGTGYELMEKGKFFEHCMPIIYDLLEGLKDKAINNCALYGEYFDFSLPSDCYKPDKELNGSGIKKFRDFFKGVNKKGKTLLKHGSFATAKLEKIIKEVSGKTLVIIPHGTGYEEALANFICVISKSPQAAVVNISKLGTEQCNKNEAMFRSNKSKTNFMVVIAKCATGWDFPSLNNVIDLTFTRSHKAMIQRLARTIRTEPGKPVSKYIYCTDQSREKNRVIYDLSYALRLTTELGILACAGGKKDAGIPEFLLKKMLRMSGPSGKEKDSIEPISFDEFMPFKRERLLYRTLKQIQSEGAPWTRLWKPVLHRMMSTMKKEKVMEFAHLLTDSQTPPEDLLKIVSTKTPQIYAELFQNRPIQSILQEYELC